MKLTRIIIVGQNKEIMKGIINKDKVLACLLQLSLCQNEEEAIQWYKNSCLESCGHKTPEELVDNGLGYLVINYIERIANGGFAWFTL